MSLSVAWSTVTLPRSAMASASFNLGEGALARPTLLRLLNDGRTDEVGPQFLRWNNGPNGPMPGLTRRRTAEKAMFEGVGIHAGWRHDHHRRR